VWLRGVELTGEFLAEVLLHGLFDHEALQEGRYEIDHDADLPLHVEEVRLLHRLSDAVEVEGELALLLVVESAHLVGHELLVSLHAAGECLMALGVGIVLGGDDFERLGDDALYEALALDRCSGPGGDGLGRLVVFRVLAIRVVVVRGCRRGWPGKDVAALDRREPYPGTDLVDRLVWLLGERNFPLLELELHVDRHELVVCEIVPA
jgi:hypothetical protein